MEGEAEEIGKEGIRCGNGGDGRIVWTADCRYYQTELFHLTDIPPAIFEQYVYAVSGACHLAVHPRFGDGSQGSY